MRVLSTPALASSAGLQRLTSRRSRMAADARMEQDQISPETCYHVAESAQGAAIEIKDFNLWYGETQAIHNVSMRIEKGLVTAMIGPSGCGKSTLLRSLNRM